MLARELIGKRGEAIVMSALMDFCGNREPYFDPHFLGEKCPTFDYLVELINAGVGVPYFFVQVKTTRKGSTKKKRHLSAKVTREDVEKMVQCPLPTYVVAVDEPAQTAYIVSVHGKLEGAISSIPTAYPLNADNLRKLWQEVRDYWQRLDSSAKSSIFAF